MYQHTYKTRTRFADSDAAGVIHFTRILCYVEEAEHAALADLGSPVDVRGETPLHWPRVSLSTEYLAPAYPQEEISVHLSLEQIGRSSLTWAWEMRNPEQLLARGTLKTVCCQVEGARLVPVALPERIRNLSELTAEA